MRIMNNIPALTAFTSLNSTNDSLQKIIGALSTGLRINSASDDAAGFAVSEKMRSQIRGLDTALRNSQDGISLLQTAEGALGETNSMLQRMRDLSVQASNDSLTSNDRQYIQLEIDEIMKQIDQIANTTQFNKKRILDGSSGALWASSDPGVRAIIHGGLTRTDNFGQKVSAEGNYRIEVTANPGEAQVQKTNIMPVAEYGIDVDIQKVTEPIIQTVYEVETITEEVTEMVTELQRTVETVKITETQTIPHIIRLNEGVDSINQTSGDGWEFKDGSLIITGSGTYDIRGTQGANAANSPNIIVKSGANANIFLTDVNIDKTRTGSSSVKGQAGMEIESGANANVLLAGNNSLKGGAGRACLEVAHGGSICIFSADGDGQTTGTLTAINSSKGAGIGGGGLPSSQGRTGHIIIRGGRIEARGGDGCAGIGGGDTSSYDGGGYINIFAGDITAWGGICAAGIGSGFNPDYPLKTNTSNNTQITIALIPGYSCKVRAYGGGGFASGAGIGGSAYSSAGTITINQTLFDSGNIVAVSGGTGADRIGHGTYGNENADNNVSYSYVVGGLSNTPGRPTITAEVEHEEEREVYTEVTRPVTRLITRQVEKKVDKIVGERVVDEIPIIRGLDGNFVYKPKPLGELPAFYNSSGVCIADPSQTIKITQGNGKTASVTIYPTDTMDDVSRKINDAISGSLGQGSFTDNPAKFCTLADGTAGTSEAAYSREPIYCEEGYLSEYGPGLPAGTLIGYKVNSTMLVRSAIPGKNGEISFSGDEEILRALGLNTIRESSETKFTASIYDAHSGKVILSGEKLTGNVIHDALTGVDIEFGSMAGIKSSWEEGSKRFVFTSGDKYSAVIHLKDNGITFQTGANMGEDFSIQLGDMSAKSLGLSRVNLSTRESAASSIGIIDRAITRISSQRAKIGAYINGLEHTMSSLTTTSANLTEAESRLRDADMAKTMMDFVRLQILNQSGTSMLAQANQLPQSVMSLMQ